MHNLMFPRYELRDIEMSAWGSLPVHAPQAAAVPARQPYWNCPNNPEHALESYPRLLSQNMRCKVCGIAPQFTVPARQDAVPDEKNVVHIGSFGEPETRALTDMELDLICRGLQIASQGAAKSMASELQDRRAQAAVGEGELPALPKRTEWDEEEPWFELTYRRDQLRAEMKAHKLAIAQRDEAIREAENLRRALAEAEFAILDAVNAAAATEFKPDERLNLLDELVSALEHPLQRGELSVRVKRLLSRLRSIPSEPAGIQGKAAENG